MREKPQKKFGWFFIVKWFEKFQKNHFTGNAIWMNNINLKKALLIPLNLHTYTIIYCMHIYTYIYTHTHHLLNIFEAAIQSSNLCISVNFRRAMLNLTILSLKEKAQLLANQKPQSLIDLCIALIWIKCSLYLSSCALLRNNAKCTYVSVYVYRCPNAHRMYENFNYTSVFVFCIAFLLQCQHLTLHSATEWHFTQRL